jgi:hypothetical protein
VSKLAIVPLTVAALLFAFVASCRALGMTSGSPTLPAISSAAFGICAAALIFRQQRR